MCRLVTEGEFRLKIQTTLLSGDYSDIGCVTGPGRSGAVAAVYASHILRVPFIPFGSKAPGHLGRLLVIDTASASGKTLRKAVRRYETSEPMSLAIYDEPPRVMFWYEGRKPQRYRHDRRLVA